MEDARKTAWWIRRLGAAAVLFALALVLGGVVTREASPDPSPAVETQADDRAAQRYGPNPARRLSPQIHRIIRVAQRNKLDDDKKSGSGGAQFKSAPVQKKIAPVIKKETAPVKKSTTPTTRKKETAPVLKKKDTAPVLKKKETAPAAKKKVAPVKKDTAPVLKKKETVPVEKKLEPIKKEPVPIQKEIGPAETTTPGTGPTEQQLQENEAYCKANPTSPKCAPETKAPPGDQEQENVEFCAQNPNDPSCSKETPPATEPAPATEKICTANPKYPGCDKLVAPSLGPAPEDAGKVGSICEQNPQLPQCQQGEETTQPDEAVEGPPEAPEDDEDRPPPDFAPPGAPPPISPGPPPPPPSDGGEEGTTGPSGPTIQTVDQCPSGQVPWGDQCVYPGNCPAGQVEYIDFSTDPPQYGQCGDSCPGDQVARAGACIGETVCYTSGGVSYEGQCLSQCPTESYELNSRCIRAGECQSGFVGEGPDNCRQCEGAGGTTVDGACQCNEPIYVESPDPNSSAVCEPCNQVVYEGQCIAQCPQGTLYNQGFCVTECPEGRVQGEGDSADACVPESCPEGTLRQSQSCVAECDTGSGYDFVHEGQCLTSCPDGLIEHEGQCLTECPSGTITHQGQCLTECPDNMELILGQCLLEQDCPGNKLHLQTGESFEGECVDACPEGMVELQGRCIGSAVCGQWGGINYEGQCLESCPEGAVTVGGVGCAAECPSGMVNVGGQCAECAGNQYVLNGECRPICEWGQVDIGGTCRPFGEVGYEEYIDECAAAVDGASEAETQAAEAVFGDVANAGGARLCQIMVDSLCNEAEELAAAPLCADRVPPCPQGELIGPDGGCTPECESDQVVLDNMCRSECPPGTNAFQGQCRAYCPGGYEAVDGQCVAGCAPGLTAGADGQCTNPCPEGETYFADPGAAAGSCRASCPEGQGFTGAGACRDCNRSSADFVAGSGTQIHYVDVNGNCTLPYEVPYEDALQACMAGDYGLGLPGGEEHSQSECEQAVAGLCESGQELENSRFCAELPAGVAPPEDGEIPVAEGPSDDGAPPDETTPPSDETTPPPDETAPPPTDGEAPPPPPDETAPPPPSDETAPPSPGGTPLPPLPFPGGPPALPPAEGTKPAPPAAKDEAASEAAPAKPIAVVIGIGDYKDSDIPAAPQAIDNAAHMVRFLKDDLGLDGLRILTGRNASLSDFEDIFGKPGDPKSELRDLVKKTRTSEVIVYYAGNAKVLDGGKDVLLLPADAEPDKPETGVSLSALYNQLAAMGIKKLRVYLDPSFLPGDRVVKVETAPRIGPFGILTPRDWVALSAASDAAAMPDAKDRPRSLFTESLVAGLRGIADTTGEGNADGTVSAKELHDFTRGQAAAAAKRGDKAPMPSLYGPPGEPLRAY